MARRTTARALAFILNGRGPSGSPANVVVDGSVNGRHFHWEGGLDESSGREPHSEAGNAETPPESETPPDAEDPRKA